MKRLPVLVLVLMLAVAGCGGGDKWGGYTEGQAKDILVSDELRNSILGVSPFDPQGRPYTQLLPTKAKLDQTDLLKSQLEGQEAWEYRDRLNAFCLYVWKDKDSGDFTTFVGCA
jgi:hypothetical protein